MVREMVSFRRTLSPANHDRRHQIDASNLNLPYSQRHSSKLLPSLLSGAARFISAVLCFKLPKRGGNGLGSWRRSFYRCVFFFLLGFMFGIAPFNGIGSNENDDVGASRLSFEIKPPPFSAEVEPNVVNVESLDVKEKKRVMVGEESLENLDGVGIGINDTDAATDVTDAATDVVGIRKQLIVVTPTYNRALQAYYLNRVVQVLRLVPPPLLWIVVEMNVASMETAGMLRKSSVMYRHLVCKKNGTEFKDRGVHQRNTALEHIEHHRLDGIVYFADDDNIYSLGLFDSIREIRCFGTWPVSMLAQSKNKAILEGPVCNASQVIGWHTNEKSKKLRRFHVDMSGFAFNSTILWDPKRWKRPFSNPIRQLDSVKEGFQETTFIQQLVEDENQMEGIPPGCGTVLNWHLHLDAQNLIYPKGWVLQKDLDAVTHSK